MGHIRCDLGTNSVGAKSKLQVVLVLKEMNHDKIQQTLSQDGCDWVQLKMNIHTASGEGWCDQLELSSAILSSVG